MAVQQTQMFTRVGVVDEQGRQQAEPGWRCPSCDMTRGEDRVDPCLGRLSGVKFACCGHGGLGLHAGYVAFESGQVIRFHHCEVDRVKHLTTEKPTSTGAFPYFDLARNFCVSYETVLSTLARVSMGISGRKPTTLELAVLRVARAERDRREAVLS